MYLVVYNNERRYIIITLTTTLETLSYVASNLKLIHRNSEHEI